MKNIRHQWLRYSLCFVLLVVLFSPIVDSFANHLPTGFKVNAGQEGKPCLSQEPESWIKKFVGIEGCVKVDYKVHPDCGKFSDQWRNVNGMSDCQAPKGPTDKELQDQREQREREQREREQREREQREREQREREQQQQQQQYQQQQQQQYQQQQYQQQQQQQQQQQYQQQQYQQQQQQYQQQSSNSKINQDDDYVIWAGLGIVGIVGIALIIKKFSKSNNTGNKSYGNIPPDDDPPVGDKDNRTDIQKQIDENNEKRRKIEEELYGKNPTPLGNTPTDIEQSYAAESWDDITNDDDQSNDDQSNDDQSNDDQSNDDQSNDENESIREDIEERISNNEKELEELKEHRQEIEDDREDGLFRSISDMNEADRIDDKISEREERIEELNEASDEYESDDNDHDDDYDDDDR